MTILSIFEQVQFHLRCCRYMENFFTFKAESAKSVGYMVKEFEMKKTDEYNRSGVLKSGMNINKLYPYKWSEDIFKKNM